MNCDNILKLFQSELVVVNVGPKLFAEALEKQGYKTLQVEWKPVAGGDREILEVLGGLD